MSKPKFKVGDKVRVLTVEDIDKSCGFEVGDIVIVNECGEFPYCITKNGDHMFRRSQLELVSEDRSNWHPHRDVIVALVDELEREALQQISVYIIEKLNKDKGICHIPATADTCCLCGAKGHKSGDCPWKSKTKCGGKDE